jgi:hypothetical protein
MEMAEFAGAVIMFSLGSHLAVRAAPAHWQRGQRERRERALRRLADVVREAEPAQQKPLASGTWQAAEFSRYFVPVGLRLDQARRVIREAQEAEKIEGSG